MTSGIGSMIPTTLVRGTTTDVYCASIVGSIQSLHQILSLYHERPMTQTTLTVDDIQNLLTLIDFHDDWDEVKDVWGFDIEPLFDKLHAMLEDA